MFIFCFFLPVFISILSRFFHEVATQIRLHGNFWTRNGFQFVADCLDERIPRKCLNMSKLMCAATSKMSNHTLASEELIIYGD